MTGDGPAASVAALSAALGADPGRGDLWGELATALVAARRPREAWDAAARAVQLAPRSAASHRAIGTVAAALGDPRQAESAYRHALLLDPADQETRTALARLPAPTTAPTARPAAPAAGAAAVAGAAGVPGARVGGSRHAAAEDDEPSTGRHGAGGRRRAPEPDEAPAGGRRRAPEPDDAPAAGRRRASEPGDAPAGGRRRAAESDDAPVSGRRRAAESDDAPAGGRRRAREAAVMTAVGLPGWLAPNGGARPDPTATGWPVGPPRPAGNVPVGATRAADPARWRRELVAIVRAEWLVGLACFVGLAYARTAPYTAGLLAGLVVVAVAYGRVRWRAGLGPPSPAERIPTYAAGVAVAAAVVVVPAAMLGALTLARLAAVAAVTCATFAAVLLGRTGG
jgi:hypothetical protein